MDMEDVAVNNMSAFVGNLTWETTSEDLDGLFSQYSPVSAEVKMGHNGRSRGYGIVSFNSSDDAARAIGEMNGYEHDGRVIVVRLERQKPVQQSRENESVVYCGNLHWDVDWHSLKDLFTQNGLEPQHADVKIGKNGRSRGWGLVRFADKDTAQQAIDQLNGFEFEGRPLNLHFDRQ